jgi:hypothetical protein
MGQIVAAAVWSMGKRILTSTVIEKVTIWALEHLVAQTDSKADDELLKIVKDAL